MTNPTLRRAGAALCIAAAWACSPFEEGRLTLSAPSSAPADGASVYEIEVCAAADDLGDVDVVLDVSSGEWLVPPDPASPREATVRIDDAMACASDRWIVSNDLRTVRFRALVDGEPLATAETQLTPAPLDGVEFSPSAAFLADGGESLITIGVRGVVEADGETAGTAEPTIGSRVTLDVQSEPPNMAAVNDRYIVFGSAESRTLQAAAGTDVVTITARDSARGSVLGTLVLERPGR